MKELIEYREKLVARLAEASKEFCQACLSFKDPSASVDGGWNIHQFAFHVRGIDRELYGMRLRKTLKEDNPLFKNFEPEDWMEANYNKSESLEVILNEFSANIQEICDLMGNAPQETWSRMSSHEALGSEMTLQLWAERELAHIEEHLAELKKAKKV